MDYIMLTQLMIVCILLLPWLRFLRDNSKVFRLSKLRIVFRLVNTKLATVGISSHAPFYFFDGNLNIILHSGISIVKRIRGFFLW